MKKRLLAIIATVAMVVAMMPSMVFGATHSASNETELAAAIATAASGDVIQLTGSFATSETFTIPDGKSITLDMNGKKITATDTKTSGNYELFYILGEMTVTGDGNIELSSTTDRNWDAMSAIFHNRGGVLTIENGIYKNLGGTDMAWVVDNSGNSYGDVVTNIKGGTLESSYIAIRNRMDTYGENGVVTLNVSGGSLSGKYAIWGQVASAGVKGETNITGGSFAAWEGNDAILLGTDSNPTGEYDAAVSGGEFSSDVSALVTDNSLMVAIKYASGNTTGYFVGDEAEEAVENAPAGSTIEILKAPAGTEIKDVPAGVTVVNTTNNTVKVNGTEVAAEGKVEIKATAKPEASPNTGDNTAAPFAVAGLVLAAMAAAVAARRRYN